LWTARYLKIQNIGACHGIDLRQVAGLFRGAGMGQKRAVNLGMAAGAASQQNKQE
jgi:hypothetical protein